ncbi:EamA-like transporter family protein [Pseudosporangium ferrugineum]|uniref:EamA-like transporter family protein n=2 Tax=Pseudosporangium ferrugineum TaxID=439699 RepID=A0A2T0S594_9ACTN|nr:EamA-like transporter family protein [Pseudosporangium ferrugineum]
MRSTPAYLVIGALVVAVVAVSSSAPLIAFAAAPALAVAFWRNGLAFVALTPISAGPRRAEVRTLASVDGLYCVLAGVALAAHFATWMPSVQLGSVATATALVATQPVWQGLIAAASSRLQRVRAAAGVSGGQGLSAPAASSRGQGPSGLPGAPAGSSGVTGAAAGSSEVPRDVVGSSGSSNGGRSSPSRLGWVGIALAVAGVGWATGVDIGVSAQAVLADILALLGAMAAAVYTAFGERARTRFSTTTYTWTCYGTCAIILLVVCLAAGVRMTGYDGRTWAAILALVVGAQLLGHSMFNYALHHVSATTVSVLILLEVPGAALLAWAWLGQTPRPAALPGLAVLVAGVAVVILASARNRTSGTTSASLADAADPAPS